MNIKINGLYDFQSFSIISIENVSEELILINLELKNDQIVFSSRPVHCRYDFGDFPPLDISFDSETGLLKEITLFVRKSRLIFNGEVEDTKSKNVFGYPFINTNFMVENEFYYDEICNITLILSKLSLSIVRPEYIKSKRVIINENISILLDKNDTLFGIEINNINLVDFI